MVIFAERINQGWLFVLYRFWGFAMTLERTRDAITACVTWDSAPLSLTICTTFILTCTTETQLASCKTAVGQQSRISLDSAVAVDGRCSEAASLGPCITCVIFSGWMAESFTAWAKCRKVASCHHPRLYKWARKSGLRICPCGIFRFAPRTTNEPRVEAGIIKGRQLMDYVGIYFCGKPPWL